MGAAAFGTVLCYASPGAMSFMIEEYTRKLNSLLPRFSENL